MIQKTVAFVLIVGLAGCVGGTPEIRMRPGSNMVLPQQPSLVEGLVETVVCAGKDSNGSKGVGERHCTPRLNSFPTRRDTIPR